MRTSSFWDVAQRMSVNFRRRFGTANRTHLQGLTVHKNDGQQVEKCRIGNGVGGD
jgi:hypothetical protein